MATATPSADFTLARQARERFVDEAARSMDALGDRIAEALRDPATRKRGMSQHAALEAGAAFQQKARMWIDAARSGWRQAFARQWAGEPGLGACGSVGGITGSDSMGLALVDEEQMERTVVVGRLVAAIVDKAGEELVRLRVRVRRLERRDDFSPEDVLRPQIFAQALLDAWAGCGLTLGQWMLAQGAAHDCVARGLGQACERANAFLTEQGVKAEIDLRGMVRRTPGGATVAGRLPGAAGFSVPATLPGGLPLTGPGNQYGPMDCGAPVIPVAGRFVYAPPGSAGRAGYEAVIYGGVAGAAAEGLDHASSAGALAGGGGSHLGVLQLQRAKGVLGDLRQFVARHTGAALAVNGEVRPVSPALALALFDPATEYLPRQTGQGTVTDIGPDEVDKAAEKLKDQSEELKNQAQHPDEKAIIEIVSLMFQAILADERMPPILRVWFGRLQVPVLRVALAEPAFFAEPEHPARRLIDRMGACAMGLDNARIDDGRLEQEVRRIVQVIEQYPETGKKVFEIVLDEFETFLGSALAQGQSQKFATLAQQIEQKDALAIQYTIELRRMLGAVSVGEDVRQFLFRVWPEVLALAAVRQGAQAEETVRFKQVAADLLWAASPKTDRAERQQVAQYLPGILQTLRQGMQTLAMQTDEQEEHMRLLSQAVAQAFHAPGGGITSAQMNELAQALTALEDVVTDDPEGDLLLDPSLLEQMLGVDGQNLLVIASGGARPSPDMQQWARALQRGQWFTLHHQGAAVRVQYVWRSVRGQLHLFAATADKSYLIQTRRLASYLQAGLLAPLDDEALTIRATREALARLNRQPEQLLR